MLRIILFQITFFLYLMFWYYLLLVVFLSSIVSLRFSFYLN